MSWCFASWALNIATDLTKITYRNYSVAVFRVKTYSEIISKAATLKLFTHFQSENESRKSMTAALFYSVHASHTAVSTV